jgi:hypothetical protein
MTAESGSEHRRLEALVGTWMTEGWTREGPGAPAMRIDAVDTYEWLPGGFGLLHVVDAKVGDERVEGAEIIGYDPALGRFRTQYFGSDGPSSYEASLEEEDGVLVWRMQSESDRFAGAFADDGDTLTGHWEARGDDATWRPWMDITLTRQA